MEFYANAIYCEYDFVAIVKTLLQSEVFLANYILYRCRHSLNIIGFLLKTFREFRFSESYILVRTQIIENNTLLTSFIDIPDHIGSTQSIKLGATIIFNNFYK